VQLESKGVTGRVAFERGERQSFTLHVLQLQRDAGLETVYAAARSKLIGSHT